MANHIPGRTASAPRSNASNPGYRGGDERPRRDDEPTIDTSRIRFGDQIAPTLYSDVAEAAARSIADTSMRDANKGTQLRRFYDELVMLQGKVGNSGRSVPNPHYGTGDGWFFRYHEDIPVRVFQTCGTESWQWLNWFMKADD